MANLVDQINEMIDILEVVNPAAARAFRDRSPSVSVSPVQPGPVQMASAQLNTIQPSVVQPVVQVRPTVLQESLGTEIGQKAKLIPEGRQNPLKLNLTPDRLVEGIVLSEVLGRPVSKKRGFGHR